MRRRVIVSFLVSFVVLGGAVVGASLMKLQPHPDYAAGSTGHTLLTETTGTYCTSCHTGTAVTAAFTDTAGAAITTAQLYPGETGTFNIRAALAAGYTGSLPYQMGANIAANGGALSENEAALVKTGAELQHSSTAGTLKTVAAGSSNSYTFSYTLTNTAVPVNSTIAGITVVDYPGGGQHAPSITVTSRRPADPTSVTPGTSDSSSVVLNWLSSGPLNRIVVKTGAFATSPTDATGTAYDVAGSTTTISGLSQATTYFFKLWDLARFSPYDTYSTNGVTTTAATTTAPLIAATDLTVTNLTSSGMTLTWRGTSPEFRAIYKAASVPTSPTDGIQIYEGVNTTAPVSGLSGSTRYFIAVYGKASGAATYSPTADTTSVITLDGSLIDAIGAAGGPRQPNTSQGQVLYGNDPIYLFNGTTTTAVQAVPSAGENVEPTVFELGSASIAGHVIGAWRRGTDHLWVSIDGGTPVLVPSAASNPFDTTKPTNPENVAIADGCVFATLQAFFNASAVKHVFKIDPVSGNATNLTGNAGVPGLYSRIRTSGCKAVWGFDDGTTNLQMHYYPGTGTTIQTIDTVAKSATFFGIGQPWISQGKIVYGKIVGGVPQIFLYDTNLPSPTPVQLTNYTDATMGVSHPQTDGRHIVWFRSKADGTLPEIDFNGGVTLATGASRVLGNELEHELNRGQLLWSDSNGNLRYETASSSTTLSVLSTILNPWLSDGYIAYGDSANAGAFRFTGSPPNDAQQPAAPLVVQATAGTGSVALKWDAILGATSYNVYYSSQPGLTKANYASLGGTRILGITSPSFTVTGLAPNAPYYFVITTVDPSGEGPESRQASAVVIGTPSWTSVGLLSATAMFAAAADRTSPNAAYASGGNNTYASTDGGQTWSLLGGGIAGVTVHGLAADSGTVFATSTNGSIYRSTNGGSSWSAVVSATSQSFQQSIAIDPAIATTILAGEFRLPSFTSSGFDSNVIRSDDNGANWFHAPAFTNSIVAYSLAFDPTRTSTLFLGGNGTPNVAKSLAGGAGWINIGLPTSASSTGYVYTVAIDPQNSQTIYAGTTQTGGSFFPGVWKSTNGGTTWTQLTTGLPTSTPVHSIVVDPADSNVLHLGTEVGYYYSTNAGASWTLLNDGLPNTSAQFIYSLAMTGSHRLIAATGDGLYLLNLSVAPAPTVSSVNPNSGNIAGGTSVTITGSGFGSGATVTFGSVAATSVSVANSTTMTAITPAHAAGTVDVVVRNSDGQTGTLASGFTYTTALTAPANVNAYATAATQVTITWSVVPGATSYQVYRRSAGGGFVAINPTTTSTSYTDNGVTGGNSYLYLVQALNSSTSSLDSSADIATTIFFTDDPIVAGSTIVQAVHLAEIRTAANAVRALGNQMLVTFTTGAASAGTIVTAAQINEVRSALDGGLNALPLPSGGYTDTLAAGVPIKAVHFQEIRNRTK